MGDYDTGSSRQSIGRGHQCATNGLFAGPCPFIEARHSNSVLACCRDISSSIEPIQLTLSSSVPLNSKSTIQCTYLDIYLGR